MKKIAFRHSRSGFTLIELLVGMTIFSIAITSIFLLLESTMKSVRISRNEVIVSNLLREQLELVRNVRDANLAKGAAWNVARIDDGAETNFSSGTFLIENDFSTNVTKFGNDSTGNFSILESPVKIKKANFSSDEIEKKFGKITNSHNSRIEKIEGFSILEPKKNLEKFTKHDDTPNIRR